MLYSNFFQLGTFMIEQNYGMQKVQVVLNFTNVHVGRTGRVAESRLG